MAEISLKLVATVLLDLKMGCTYDKLELALKTLGKNGICETQITLISDTDISEVYDSFHNLSEGLAFEIIFEYKPKEKESIDHLLSHCRYLIQSWKEESLFPGLEFYFQDFSVYKAQKKLFIFDMDSTLIQQEVIDEMAKIVGVGQQVSKITESAMRGEIDFKASLSKRVALLQGAPESIFDEVCTKIEFSRGARDLCSYLKSKGCILAVVSGGFLPLANYVKSELSLDYAFANQLASDSKNSTLTGETLGEVVTAEKKALILQELAAKHDIPLQNVVAVGDGANDLLMMDAAGLSIAYNAKPKVQEKAIGCINRPSLLNLTLFLGVKNSEFA